MRFKNRRRIDTEDQATSTVAQDCESFLNGAYLDTVYSRGQDVPSWAWINKLSRSSEEALIRLARNPGSPDPRPELWAWRRTVSFLAAEILDVTERTCISLSELQEMTLAPIEFAAMAEPMGPSTTLRVVLSALHERAHDRA